MANTLWGTGMPSFIIRFWLSWQAPHAGCLSTIIPLPQPSEYEMDFVPDTIIHNIITGKRIESIRGYRLKCTLYYDLLRGDIAYRIRDILLQSSASDRMLLFKPHSDYSRSYFVKVNEEEGWNFRLVQNKYAHGYEGSLIIRGIEWLPTIPRPKPPDPSPDPSPDPYDWVDTEEDVF